MEIQEIEIGKIYADPTNPRSKIEDVEELANTIQEQGQLVPVEVEKIGDTYVTMEGHRRCEALRILKKRTKKPQNVKCIVVNKLSDDEKLIRRAAIDAQMKNLTVEDRDNLWEKIWVKVEKGIMTKKDFADKIGVNSGQVRHFLDRRTLDPKIKVLFKENTGILQETISLEPSKREKVLKHAHKRGIGAMALRQEVKILKTASDKLIDAFTKDEIDINQINDLSKMSEEKQEEAITSISNTKRHIKNIPKIIKKNSSNKKGVDEERVKSAQEFVQKINNEILSSSMKINVLSSVLDTMIDEKMASFWPEEVKEAVLEGLEDLNQDLKEMTKTIDKVGKNWRKK